MLPNIQNIVFPIAFISIISSTLESRIADGRYAIGDRHARQAGAARKRKIADARHAVGNYYARQAVAGRERMVSNC